MGQKAVKKGQPIPSPHPYEESDFGGYEPPKAPKYHSAKWVCPECTKIEGFFPNSGQRHDTPEPCPRGCGPMEFVFKRDHVCGSDRRDWDERKDIASLPVGHPDRWVKSPYEAAKVMEKHGLWKHPSDESKTPVAVDIVPDSPPSKGGQIALDLPIDIAKRRGVKNLPSARTREEVLRDYKRLGIKTTED
jgi:hypothetical protein